MRTAFLINETNFGTCHDNWNLNPKKPKKFKVVSLIMLTSYINVNINMNILLCSFFILFYEKKKTNIYIIKYLNYKEHHYITFLKNDTIFFIQNLRTWRNGHVYAEELNSDWNTQSYRDFNLHTLSLESLQETNIIYPTGILCILIKTFKENSIVAASILL